MLLAASLFAVVGCLFVVAVCQWLLACVGCLVARGCWICLFVFDGCVCLWLMVLGRCWLRDGVGRVAACGCWLCLGVFAGCWLVLVGCVLRLPGCLLLSVVFVGDCWSCAFVGCLLDCVRWRVGRGWLLVCLGSFRSLVARLFVPVGCLLCACVCAVCRCALVARL